MLDESVELARSLGDERATALALNNRGDVALTQGDWASAEALFEESLALLRRLGDRANVARSLFNLGASALEQADDDRALALLRESLALCGELDDREDLAWCLVALAALAERNGDAELGATLIGAATGTIESIGASLKPYERTLYERTVSTLAERLEPARLDELSRRGRSLAPADAVAAAGAGARPPDPSAEQLTL